MDVGHQRAQESLKLSLVHVHAAWRGAARRPALLALRGASSARVVRRVRRHLHGAALSKYLQAARPRVHHVVVYVREDIAFNATKCRFRGEGGGGRGGDGGGEPRDREVVRGDELVPVDPFWSVTKRESGWGTQGAEVHNGEVRGAGCGVLHRRADGIFPMTTRRAPQET
jgi:hypothetical protein